MSSHQSQNKEIAEYDSTIYYKAIWSDIILSMRIKLRREDIFFCIEGLGVVFSEIESFYAHCVKMVNEFIPEHTFLIDEDTGNELKVIESYISIGIVPAEKLYSITSSEQSFGTLLFTKGLSRLNCPELIMISDDKSSDYAITMMQNIATCILSKEWDTSNKKSFKIAKNQKGKEYFLELTKIKHIAEVDTRYYSVMITLRENMSMSNYYVPIIDKSLPFTKPRLPDEYLSELVSGRYNIRVPYSRVRFCNKLATLFSTVAQDMLNQGEEVTVYYTESGANEIFDSDSQSMKAFDYADGYFIGKNSSGKNTIISEKDVFSWKYKDLWSYDLINKITYSTAETAIA